MALRTLFRAAYQRLGFTELDLNTVDWYDGVIRQKDVPVRYRLAAEGEVVRTLTEPQSWLADFFIGRHEEKVAKAGAGHVIVINPSGEEYLFRGGVGEEDFLKEHTPTQDGRFMPNPDPRLMVWVDRNRKFANSGKPDEIYYVQAGGFVVFNGYREDGSARIYPLQAREARMTYGKEQAITVDLIKKTDLPKGFSDTYEFAKRQKFRQWSQPLFEAS